MQADWVTENHTLAGNFGKTYRVYFVGSGISQHEQFVLLSLVKNFRCVDKERIK